MLHRCTLGSISALQLLRWRKRRKHLKSRCVWKAGVAKISACLDVASVSRALWQFLDRQVFALQTGVNTSVMSRVLQRCCRFHLSRVASPEVLHTDGIDQSPCRRGCRVSVARSSRGSVVTPGSAASSSLTSACTQAASCSFSSAIPSVREAVVLQNVIKKIFEDCGVTGVCVQIVQVLNLNFNLRAPTHTRLTQVLLTTWE